MAWTAISNANIDHWLSIPWCRQESGRKSRYLAQFAYRFNRRYRHEEMIPRLAWVALRTPPMPYHLLKQDENST